MRPKSRDLGNVSHTKSEVEDPRSLGKDGFWLAGEDPDNSHSISDAVRKVEIAVDNTETVSFPDRNGKLVVEITPYRSMGIAQVVTMTTEQSTKIADYARRQSKILTELGRTDLLLDVTYVPEEKWSDDILRRIPGGSAVFPILSLRTVPIEHVKHLLR